MKMETTQERKIFAGMPPSKRPHFKQLCVICAGPTTIYPGFEMTPIEIEKRQKKYICGSCRKNTGKSADDLELLRAQAGE
jgi:hypothetical protein